MSGYMKDAPAWGISLVVNLSILAIFNFVIYERIQPQEVNTIISDVDDTRDEEERLNFSERVTDDQVGNDGNNMSLTPSMQVTSVGQNDTPLQEKIEEILNPEIPRLSEASVPKLEGNISQIVAVKGDSDNVVGGADGAMDRVAFEIRQSLKVRKTLVIWLFDASGSLNDRREAIANRFDNIYKQLGKQGTTEGLYSMVVAFGKDSNILTPEPIQDIARLSEVVRKEIKEDKSGVENVFATVKLVLEKYRTWKRLEGPWNKMIFVVTDERGDDAEQYLEDVISMAKRSQTKVFTIGNAAIFGREKGYVLYKYPDGFEEEIAVDQGPESAFPDGLQLPFVGSRPDWKLRQMSASYGPYALTRLCAETGGMYLITEDTRGYAFDRAIMRRYAPDYRPVRVQEMEIVKNAAKVALVSASKITYDQSIPALTLEFRAYNDNILRTDLGEAQKPAAEVDYALKKMFAALSPGETARDSLREERWRAAFDLAMGRLLAMRVRIVGYNQMLAAMKVAPKAFSNDKDNMWRLVPSDKIESGPEMRKAAEQAKMYLDRVINEHAGTPWALMAEREKASQLGWTWEGYSEPIPGSDQLRGTDEEVARLLLAEEERREEMRKKAAQRAKPKL